MLGIGAAIAGMIVYAAFTIVTGWYIGYLALGVGYLVAKAMKKGSHGLGGRRYQVAAVLLTYAAISVAAVPIGISYAIKHKQQKPAATQNADVTVNGDSASSQPASAPKAPSAWARPSFSWCCWGWRRRFLSCRIRFTA